MMKLLFDQNLSHRLCEALEDVFPGSGHVRSLGLATADDEVIWKFARDHGYAIVTHDSDFAELAALRKSPPKIVWLRCGNQHTSKVESLLRNNREAIEALDGDESTLCIEIYLPLA